MTVLERLGSVAASGATFATNFWPWLLAAFLLGAGTAGWAGFGIAKLVYQGEALRAQSDLAQFQASVSKAAALGEANAAAERDKAWELMRARDRSTDEALGNIPGQVAALLGPKFKLLGESINEPRFDCLRLPLPTPALRLLERPGGVATEDREGAGASADPGGLSH